MTDSEKLDLILKELSKLDNKVSSLDDKVSSLEKRVIGIEVTIENEVTNGIKIVAEGHLDLNRKLNEAVHIASDIKAKQEIHDLLLKNHESRLKIRDVI